MKLLVIGGTQFSGRALTERALERGHEVTLFHRGQTGAELFPGAERVLGDRTHGVGALAGRTFDGVVDTCGFVPRTVRASAELLSSSGQYTFISSLSVHPDDIPAGTHEDGPIHEPPPPELEEVTDETYGPLKVACEREVRRVFGDRACIVRPGFIVGPYDPTDRFTYWVRRAAAGGEMLAPAPPDYGLQWVDARDLAAFVLDLAEAGRGGTYSAIDPPGSCTLGELIDAARTEAEADTTVTWVDQKFVVERLGDDRFGAFPLWWPEAAGFHMFDQSRAAEAGLRCRSVAETVHTTLAWDRTRPQTWPMQAGLSPERERELLDGWHSLH